MSLSLPRGRHQLSREEVAGVQRLRVMLAMAESLAQTSLPELSVATIIKRAGVSRESFYQHFSSKQDCFLQTLDAAAQLILDAMEQAVASGGEGAEGGDLSSTARLAPVLDAYLSTLAANAGMARAFLIDVYAAGPDALERRAAMQHRFVEAAIEALGAETAEDRFACEALVAAISSLVTSHLAARDVDGLLALRDPLLALAERVLPRTTHAR